MFRRSIPLAPADDAPAGGGAPPAQQPANPANSQAPTPPSQAPPANPAPASGTPAPSQAPAQPAAPAAPAFNPDDPKVKEWHAAQLAAEKDKWDKAAAREAERAKADDLRKAQMAIEDKDRALAELKAAASKSQSEAALYRHMATTGEQLQQGADTLLQPIIAAKMAEPNMTAEKAIADIRTAYPFLFKAASQPAAPAPAASGQPPANPAPAAPAPGQPAAPAQAPVTTTPMPGSGNPAGGPGPKNMLDAPDQDYHARLQALGLRPPNYQR